MRQALLLLPDLGLFIVICRMASLGLQRSRTSVFVFFCAWFLVSLATVVAAQVVPPVSETYAAFCLAVLLSALVVPGMVALVASGTRAASYFFPAAMVVLALGVVGSLVLIVLGGWNPTFFSFGYAASLGAGPAAYEWVAFVVTAILIALAWGISPNPDALVSPQALALTPFARLLFGFARNSRG